MPPTPDSQPQPPVVDGSNFTVGNQEAGAQPLPDDLKLSGGIVDTIHRIAVQRDGGLAVRIREGWTPRPGDTTTETDAVRDDPIVDDTKPIFSTRERGVGPFVRLDPPR